ncbi:PAS domain-containing sensor histidine kinase [Ideonella sp.]|uniref:PAS domain-containing sensor histidine kinase n=1 Tax=Ideonella sp. TaxID=1929293 RepID=UPI003BB6E362
MRWLQSWLPSSLVGRVFALYSVTLLAFVMGGLSLFYRYQLGLELEEAQLRAETISAVMLPTVSDSAVIGDYDTIRRTLERAMHHSSFSSASYIDLQGGVVRAPSTELPGVVPPAWLLERVSAQLYDNNQTISVGGRDYGVLRLSFAPERIAGQLWKQARIALLLAVASLVGGLLLIRMPLVHWLGKLNRVQDFDRAMQIGGSAAALPSAESAPLEFRETFEVLGRAAASLQSQRIQADVTLGAIADGVFTLDTEGRVILANPAASQMTGLSLAEMIGQPARQIVPEVFDQAEAPDCWTGRRATLRHRSAPAVSQDVVIDTTLSPILGPDGRRAGSVLACRDVSEQHGLDQRLRAELAAREQALVALRQVLEGLTHDAGSLVGQDDLGAISAMISDLVARLQMRGEQLDAIFALSPDGFVSFDAQRRANYVSPAFARLTGLTDVRVLGASEQEIEAWLRARCSEQTPWHGFAELRRELRERAPDAPARRTLIDLLRPTRRVLELGLREGSTAAISQVLSLRDVTHESEVDQMKSEFLSTAAHELRTPMTSIYGFAELMMHRQLAPERQAQIMATIHRQTSLMITIVNELLDLARIEARRGADFELETLDLVQLATDLALDFKPPAERPGPRLALGVAQQPVRVDRNKMAQAIGNVLSNAYKYSPGGGEVAMTLVTERAEPARVGLQISDRGIGMTPEQLSRVCERFYRADASGNIPGTGLGMSITQNIIELLGGSLAVSSVHGEGSRVTLWLPLQQAEPAWAETVMEAV